MSETIVKIEKLYQQFQKGRLTAEEFAERKANLIQPEGRTPPFMGGKSVWVLWRSFFGRAFQWRGRDTRSEFWVSLGLGWLTGPLSLITGPGVVLVAIAVFFGTIAALVRRLHDVGKSAWCATMPIWGMVLFPVSLAIATLLWPVRDNRIIFFGLTYFGLIWIMPFVLACLPGMPVANRYGEPR